MDNMADASSLSTNHHDNVDHLQVNPIQVSSTIVVDKNINNQSSPSIAINDGDLDVDLAKVVITHAKDDNLSILFDTRHTAFAQLVDHLPPYDEFELDWANHVYHRLETTKFEQLPLSLVDYLWTCLSSHMKQDTLLATQYNFLTVIFNCLALIYRQASSKPQKINSSCVSFEKLTTWMHQLCFRTPHLASAALWLCFEYQKNQSISFDASFIEWLLNKFLQFGHCNESLLTTSDQYPPVVIGLNIICTYAKLKTNISTMPNILDQLNQLLHSILEFTDHQRFGCNTLLVSAWTFKAISRCWFNRQLFIPAHIRLSILRHVISVLQRVSKHPKTSSTLHTTLWALRTIDCVTHIKQDHTSFVNMSPSTFRSKVFSIVKSSMGELWQYAIPSSFKREERVLQMAAIKAIVAVCYGCFACTAWCQHIGMGTLVYILQYWINLFPSFYYLRMMRYNLLTLSRWLPTHSTQLKIEQLLQHESTITNLQQELSTVFNPLEVKTISVVIDLLIPQGCTYNDDTSTTTAALHVIRSMHQRLNYLPWQSHLVGVDQPAQNLEQGIYILCRAGLTPHTALTILESHEDHIDTILRDGPIEIIRDYFITHWQQHSTLDTLRSIFQAHIVTQCLPADGSDGKSCQLDITQFLESWQSLILHT